MKTLLAFLLCTSVASAGEIPVAQRVENHDVGICWFACAETLANSQDLPTLKGLKQRVLETGVGVGGATDERIEHWLALAHVKRRHTKTFNWEFLKRGLRSGPAVIVTLKAWQPGTKQADTHAVLLTNMQHDGKEWQFEYIDPNDIGNNYKAGQQWFMSKWIGHASYFDKADQPPQALAQKTVTFQSTGVMIHYQPPATAPSPR